MGFTRSVVFMTSNGFRDVYGAVLSMGFAMSMVSHFVMLVTLLGVSWMITRVNKPCCCKWLRGDETLVYGGETLVSRMVTVIARPCITNDHEVHEILVSWFVIVKSWCREVIATTRPWYHYSSWGPRNLGITRSSINHDILESQGLVWTEMTNFAALFTFILTYNMF